MKDVKERFRRLSKLRVERLRDIKRAQMRELGFIIGPALLVVLGAIWLASRFIEPAPPKKIAISTASQTGGYFATGKKYAEILKKSGITLEVLTSAGSPENVKRLLDPKSGVQVALLQGGTTNSEQSPGIVSLGRIYLEPMWVFYYDERTLDRLADLKGKRVIVGPEGSGTRALALALLKPNAVSAENTTYLALSGQAAIDALQNRTADAGFFTSSASSPQIQTLLRVPGLKVMSLTQAEAYTRIFPYLSRVVLPKGAIDLLNNIPAQDIQLVAPMAALVAREDLHPALVGLLVEAAKAVHSPGGMFNRIGEFPKAEDPEFDLSDDAARVYRIGPPFLHRYLPFWLATFVERMKVMLLPLATILIPLVKLIPAIYRWRVRRRLLYWYGELKDLEQRIADDEAGDGIDQHRQDLRRITAGIDYVPVPVGFSEQFYSLRAALDLVRQRLAAAGAVASAAQQG